MAKRRESVTGAEFEAKLKAEGKWDSYMARKKAQEEETRRLEREYARAEAPLVEALHAAGVPVASAWDLVNTPNHFEDSLPVLLEFLKKPNLDSVREGIARALAVPTARFAWSELLELYRQEEMPQTKSGIAVALSNICDDDQLDQLIALARDPKHGESRILLLWALEKSKHPSARIALKELAGDPVLKKEIRLIEGRRT